jgi:outer membrane receptor for ferrienterochelin and colicins
VPKQIGSDTLNPNSPRSESWILQDLGAGKWDLRCLTLFVSVGGCLSIRNPYLLIGAAWLLLGTSALAQNPRATIRIEVTAAAMPVGEASVTVNDQAVRTDKDGNATASIALGDTRIRVTKDGYFAATTSLITTEARPYDVHIELQQQEDVKQEITVYATRTDARIQDSPLHVEVLQREEIEEKMMMTPGDIVMLLNEMGGMRVQTTSPSLGAASVRVQGMLGRYTSFLADGLPLFGQQGAGLGLLQIPPIDLGQVEVIKGNASALYGSAAMAGVVDLISRRPTAEPIHEVLLNRSTLGATDASAFLAGPLSSAWSASLLGSGNWQERRDVSHDNWTDLAGYGRGVLRPRFYWDDKLGHTALLTGGITHENRSGGTMPGTVLPTTGQPYSEALRTRRYDIGGTLQWAFTNGLVAASRFSHSEQQHQHTFGEIIEHDRHQLSFGEVSLRGSQGRNTWVAGAAAQRDSYLPRDVPRFAYSYVAPGVFFQDDIRLTSWLSVSGSARVDVHNLYGTFFSPRVSALVRGGGWISRWSAGQGFFAPAPLTEETEAAGLARLTLPRPFVAERGRTASVDLTRSIGPLSITATVFAANIDHPVYVDRTNAYRILNLTTPRKNRGTELLATWRKAPFSATFSYSYVRATEREPNGPRTDIPLTPRHSLGIVGMWEKEGVARFGIESYYTGEQRLENNPYRNTSRPYLIVGAMAERKVAKHVKLFINLENLSNVRQTRWDPILLPSRNFDGRWTVDAWAPLDGRVINGGARFSF